MTCLTPAAQIAAIDSLHAGELTLHLVGDHGVRIVGGQYAPQPLAMSPATAAGSANDGEHVFPGLPECIIIGVEIDGPDGTIWSLPAQAHRKVPAGEAFRIRAGAITVNLR